MRSDYKYDICFNTRVDSFDAFPEALRALGRWFDERRWLVEPNADGNLQSSEAMQFFRWSEAGTRVTPKALMEVAASRMQFFEGDICGRREGEPEDSLRIIALRGYQWAVETDDRALVEHLKRQYPDAVVKTS